METAPLKSFATWARTALIREVTARIAVVLAPASPERVEQPNAVEALMKAVTAAGGGDKGKGTVADRVAYTWFNRIIALRFMDANGYTGVGVVSPQLGVESGQPEILAEAKRGNIDAAVVGTKTRETITALLNGTRRSDDAQGEAYALLLAEHCRYWNRAMPFMFEREGDFTELLIPANLLADDSVPSRAVKVLTTDACQDVEVVGWLYQFYISERKDEVFGGFKKNKKAGADEIPAATQLFTPHWIVRYLVENSLGRLWMLNRPSSRLVDQMQYYIAPVDEETDFLKIGTPQELKVVDPACGSGHMLTYAFDLMYAIYEEEGYAPAEIPGLILTNNLYGVEIDPRAGTLAAFALTMKARAKQRTFFNKQVGPNVCVLDPISFTQDEIDFLLTRGGDKHAESAFWNQFDRADTFGSLLRPDPDLTARLKQHIAQFDDNGDIFEADVLDWAERVVLQAEYLAQRYSVVVANPPYMGARNMASTLGAWLAENYRSSKVGLDVAFISRARTLAVSRGNIAMITMHNWMFLSGYAEFRMNLLDESRIRSLVHLGTRAFPTVAGEVVATCAFSIENAGGTAECGVFLSVTDEGDTGKKSQAVRRSVDSGSGWVKISCVDLKALPGGRIAYWLSPAVIERYRRATLLEDFVEVRKGIDTGDNGKFLRFWHEVGISRVSLAECSEVTKKWVPYEKGGSFRRWYGNLDYVVDWERDGREIRARVKWGKGKSTIRNPQVFFKAGLTYGDASFSRFSLRVKSANSLFDNAGPSIFGPAEVLPAVAALLNSCVGGLFLDFLCSGAHYQPGDVSKVLLDPKIFDAMLEYDECVKIARSDWNSIETSSEFSMSPLLNGGRPTSLAAQQQAWSECRHAQALRLAALETTNNRTLISLYELGSELSPEVDLPSVSLFGNAEFVYGSALDKDSRNAIQTRDDVLDLVSYAVGCVFGRYSLDGPGLILADQGATVQDYLAKVSSPTFAPDNDNVIPIIDGDWFEDDIVARFRAFLRAAFGEQHFEENLRFVAESLGVKDIRDYFVKSFYKDHVQRYKKRPIYWLFSSPKGSFNALIYMHRYTPSTVSTVLNEYLREFQAKLSSSLQQQERLAAGGGTPRQQAAAQKEADRLRKVLLELEEYEHDLLYPLASRQLAIDLDDGVKANYPKFGAALKKIAGLEASDE
jgi:hypothetical protein